MIQRATDRRLSGTRHRRRRRGQEQSGALRERGRTRIQEKQNEPQSAQSAQRKRAISASLQKSVSSSLRRNALLRRSRFHFFFVRLALRFVTGSCCFFARLNLSPGTGFAEPRGFRRDEGGNKKIRSPVASRERCFYGSDSSAAFVASGAPPWAKSGLPPAPPAATAGHPCAAPIGGVDARGPGQGDVTQNRHRRLAVPADYLARPTPRLRSVCGSLPHHGPGSCRERRRAPAGRGTSPRSPPRSGRRNFCRNKASAWRRRSCSRAARRSLTRASTARPVRRPAP